MHAGHVPVSAALMIVGATLCFSSLDSIVKYLAPNYPIPLLVWARWMFQVAATVAVARPEDGARPRSHEAPGLQIARGVTLVVCGLLFMTALKYDAARRRDGAQLHDAGAGLLLSRVVPARAPDAGAHRVRRRGHGRHAADRAAGQRRSSAARRCSRCSAACIYATYQILTRLLADEDPRVSLFYPALVGIVVLTPLLPFLHIRPRHAVAATRCWSCAAGCSARSATSCSSCAFQRAPASALTPFTYMQLVWAMLLGWVLFGDLPDGCRWSGMAVIAGSGLLIALYERRRARAALPPEPPAID